MYRVTGRYKELIIGAGGENIAPVPVEEAIKLLAPGVANVIMIGNNHRFNTALVTLKAEGASGELPGGDSIEPAARTFGSEGTTTVSQAVKDEKWIEHVRAAITAVNADHSVCISNVWKIQKFTILPRDFSIVGGELTSTLKTKRAVVDKKFEKVISAMYADDFKGDYLECPADLVQEYISLSGSEEPTEAVKA